MSMSESTAKIVGGVISYKGYQNNDLLIAQNWGNTGKLSTMWKPCKGLSSSTPSSTACKVKSTVGDVFGVTYNVLQSSFEPRLQNHWDKGVWTKHLMKRLVPITILKKTV